MRSKAPIILKMSFKTPSLESRLSDLEHVYYIATRPGVELNNELMINLDDNLNEDEIIRDYQMSENKDYTDYIDNRPGSHGLFDADGKASYKETCKAIENHKGITWRGIISLHGEDAERLGYTNQEAWKNLLVSNMKDIGNQMGIKDRNINWVAAYHHEKGHPHVHFVLWEKNPEQTRGLVSQRTIKEIKKDLVKDVFREDRLEAFKEKTVARDAILDMTKEEMISEKEFIREVNKVYKEEQYLKAINMEAKASSFAPKLYKDDAKEITSKMVKLAEGMKEQGGRAAYKFLKPDLKEQVDEIVEVLINKPQFTKSFVEQDQANETIVRHYSEKAWDIRQMQEKEREEMKHRIANVVVKAAKLAQNDYYVKIDDKKLKAAVKELVENKNPLALNKIDSVKNNVADTLKKSGLDEKTQEKLFNNWMDRVGLKDREFFKDYKASSNEVNIEKSARLIKSLGGDFEGYLESQEDKIRELATEKVEKVFTERLDEQRVASDEKEKINASAKEYLEKEKMINKEVDIYKNNIKKNIIELPKWQDNNTYIKETAKVLGMADPEERLLKNISKTLLMAGQEGQKLQENIDKIIANSKLDLSSEQRKKIVNQSIKEFEHAKEWKEQPFISKKDFTEIKESLNLKGASYFVEPDTKLNFENSLTPSIWKDVFKIIDQEVKRSSAEAEMQQRMAVKKYQRQQEQGREREYGE